MKNNHETLWSDCLKVVKANIAEQSFNTWFKPIIPLEYKNDILTIQVPSQFFYEWLEEHYVQILKQAMVNVFGKNSKLEYSVIVDKGNNNSSPVHVNLPNANKGFNNNYAKEKNTYISPFHLKSVGIHNRKSQLNPNYTFENYIEGDCNRLARSVGIAITKQPGSMYNPLLLYGGVGLGKTHLAQSVGNAIKNTFSDKFVLYVSSEKFANQFFDAAKDNNIQEFQNFYMLVDVLIIDDVQFLSGKEKTQDVFFNLFNHLHQNAKQIIMTSDRAPKDLKGFEDRLLSRFKWGATADLQQPDFETRVAIIQRKMQADGINIPVNVIEYLAHSVDTNIRELEGVLISLIAHASLNGTELNLELARLTLKNIVKDIETEVGVDFIQKTVSEYFNVDINLLKDKIRKKEIVIARQVAMYFSKLYTKHSLKSIGYYFGGRDHSTVIHAVQSVNDMMDVDSNFKNQIEELTKKLKSRVS